MSDNNRTDWSKYIVPLGVVAIGFFMVSSVAKALGLGKSDEEKKQEEQEQIREEAEANSMEQICKLTPTSKTEAEWKQIADTLEHDLDYAGYLTDYANDAVYQLARAKNLCDVMKLVYYFGNRQLRSPLLIKSGDYTLTQAVRERLDKEQVAIVNNNYQRKGIPYQF